jgi:hypothetical protein
MGACTSGEAISCGIDMTEIFKAGFGSLIRAAAADSQRRSGVPEAIVARLPDLSRDGLRRRCRMDQA